MADRLACARAVPIATQFVVDQGSERAARACSMHEVTP
jgi:hypothetical protein